MKLAAGLILLSHVGHVVGGATDYAFVKRHCGSMSDITLSEWIDVMEKDFDFIVKDFKMPQYIGKPQYSGPNSAVWYKTPDNMQQCNLILVLKTAVEENICGKHTNYRIVPRDQPTDVDFLRKLTQGGASNVYINVDKAGCSDLVLQKGVYATVSVASDGVVLSTYPSPDCMRVAPLRTVLLQGKISCTPPAVFSGQPAWVGIPSTKEGQACNPTALMDPYAFIALFSMKESVMVDGGGQERVRQRRDALHDDCKRTR